MYENTTIELSERQVKMVVDATFSDLDTDKDGSISFSSPSLSLENLQRIT
jgi:hypothetical protein